MPIRAQYLVYMMKIAVILRCYDRLKGAFLMLKCQGLVESYKWYQQSLQRHFKRLFWYPTYIYFIEMYFIKFFSCWERMQKGVVNAIGSRDGLDMKAVSANNSGVLKTTILIPSSCIASKILSLRTFWTCSIDIVLPLCKVLCVY